MKNQFLQLFSLAVSLIVISCSGQKTESISSKSPDGQNEIQISGSKASFADPYSATIGLKGAKETEKVTTELYASSLDDNTVKFKWNDNQNCVVTVKQTDGERIFNISISPEGMTLMESRH